MAEPELTWGQWLDRQDEARDLVRLSDERATMPWEPTDKDRAAAWILYTEMRTRIATQPLHYRSGDEETALKSLYDLFALTRKTIEDKGPQCSHFATIAIQVLNTHIRPLTAKWHKKLIAGRLQNDDHRRNFRKELRAIQPTLSAFCRLLGRMAEGDAYWDDTSRGPLPRESGDLPGRDRENIRALGPGILFDKILFDGSVAGRGSLFEAEVAAVYERREGIKPEPGKAVVFNLVGMACSGGGIRSATMCLGVAQVLAKRGILAQVDYLSTVSGGGYFGAFLSSYLNDKDRQKVGLEPGKLPFAEAGQPEPTPIRQLRNHSKYLLEGGLLGQARALGLVLFGILINLLTLLPVLLLALALTRTLELGGFDCSRFHWTAGALLVGVLILLATNVAGLPFVHRAYIGERRCIAAYESMAIKMAGGALFIGLVAWALPGLYRSLEDAIGSPQGVVGLIAAMPVLFAALALGFGFRSTVGRVLLTLAGIAGPLLLLMTYFALVYGTWVPASWPAVWASVALAAGLTAWLSAFNANWISPHRYYRNRLADTYLLRRSQPPVVDPQKLSSLRSANPRAPYHLINAAVNLPGSKEPGLRGRSSDFFVFSQHFCGSPLLGYCRTSELEEKDPSLDLGSAMAASGAAASTYMGAGTMRGLVFLLALLNVRLGYWLPNPKRLHEIRSGIGARPFSLWTELWGGLDEHDKFVNLSDGGHIENLGIYELLRRRCKLIIAVDAEADPRMIFPSLMRLIRYAQIDFGIQIRVDLDDLRPNEQGFVRAHFNLGEIDYGGGLTGYLLYIKSSLTGNERDYVLDYRRAHPSFPHETTADQFFNEAQFEAYRALGEHIANDLFREELVGKPDPHGRYDAHSWLSALVDNLFEEPIRSPGADSKANP